MNDNNTIFDLQQSRDDSRFIVENMDIDLEVSANILEEVTKIPYIGSLLKLRKIALNYIDYRFFCKLGRFLKYANDISEEKVTKFLEGLSTKDKKRISDYITQLLYTAEDENKTDLMGRIYARCVRGEINIEMLLRLCSIVNRAYVADLNYLGDYEDISNINTYVTDNLVALGVLANCGNVYKNSDDVGDNAGFGPIKHTLNEIGLTLFQIITDQTIVTKPIKRTVGIEYQIESMSEEEFDGMLGEVFK